MPTQIPAWWTDYQLLLKYLEVREIREEIMDAVNLVIARYTAKVTAERAPRGCAVSIKVDMPWLRPDEDAPQGPAGPVPEQ